MSRITNEVKKKVENLLKFVQQLYLIKKNIILAAVGYKRFDVVENDIGISVLYLY